jgi:hypothetical protein
LFSDRLLEDGLVLAEILDEPLELAVFVAKLTELSQLGDFHPAEAFLPAEKRRGTDLKPVAAFLDGRGGLRPAQRHCDLPLRKPTLPHPSILLHREGVRGPKPYSKTRAGMGEEAER